MSKSQKYKLGTPEARAKLEAVWQDLYRRQEAEPSPAIRRLERMKKRGAPIRIPETLENLRQRMWGPDGEPKTITVRGEERMPVDKTAARITAPRRRLKIHKDEEKDEEEVSRSAPEPKAAERPRLHETQAWLNAPRIRQAPFGLADLTDSRRGKLVVLGYFGKAANGVHKWVVKCDCGRFALRQRKAILRVEVFDQCDFCDQAERERR